MKGFSVAGVHYRQEWVRCGKAGCRKCPHGPYWFAYSRSSAFLKKTYVGRELPAAVLAQVDGVQRKAPA